MYFFVAPCGCLDSGVRELLNDICSSPYVSAIIEVETKPKRVFRLDGACSSPLRGRSMISGYRKFT